MKRRAPRFTGSIVPALLSPRSHCVRSDALAAWMSSAQAIFTVLNRGGQCEKATMAAPAEEAM
jgi:hypothetical protein